MLLSSAPVARMQVATAWYISHHRPPAILRKIGSMRRAGGGSGAERRSRNSVRARSYALGNGAPVAVWPRARTRVASPAVPTPHEYPGEGASSTVHESTVRVFRSRKDPGPRRARCPRAGRRALVVVRGAAAAGRALRASPRPVAAALRPRRGRCAVGGRLRERAFQYHRAVTAARAARAARTHRVVVGGRMRWRRCIGVRGSGRAGPPAPAPPTRCRRSRRRQPLCCDLQMLSVQVPGCAGMERLGAPGGPRLRHDHRHHHSTLEWEKQQRLQAMVGRLQEMVEQETRARSAAAAERLGLPPSIQLPDGEYGQDVHLQLRVPYQQAELTRSSFQPPPNKCVSDVPEWAGGAEAGGARRGKKDGLLQKATRWWVRTTRPAPPPAPPCVMVPRRAAPEPPDA